MTSVVVKRLAPIYDTLNLNVLYEHFQVAVMRYLFGENYFPYHTDGEYL